MTDRRVTDRPAQVPVAQVRALLRLLSDGEMTPTAVRQFEQVCDEHEHRAEVSDDLGDPDREGLL